MGYEINISKNGKHHFATADISFGYDLMKVKEVYNQLKTLYTEENGFKIEVSLNEKVGKIIDLENK